MLAPTKVVVAIAASMMLIGEASATCSSNACNSKIKYLYSYSDGRVIVILDEPQSEFDDITDCTLPAGNKMEIPTSDADAANRMYSALLTAKTGDKAVYIRVSSTSNPCEIAYVRTQ